MQNKFKNEYTLDIFGYNEIKGMTAFPLDKKKLLSIGLVLIAMSIWSIIMNEIRSDVFVVFIVGLAITIIAIAPSIIPITKYQGDLLIEDEDAYKHVIINVDRTITMEIENKIYVYKYNEILAVLQSENFIVLATKNRNWICLKRDSFVEGFESDFLAFIKKKI